MESVAFGMGVSSLRGGGIRAVGRGRARSSGRKAFRMAWRANGGRARRGSRPPSRGRAYERLGEPACVALLSRFRDAEGRTLQENLDGTGETAQSYLALRVFFYEGYRLSTCRSRRAQKGLAVTRPGSRAIFVCSHRFKDIQERSPSEAEAVVLHELLHSLGLGENPPASSEITSAVTKSCIQAAWP